jgi:hypothetical protein
VPPERKDQQHCRAPGAKIERIGDRLVGRAERRRAKTEREEEQRGFKGEAARPEGHAAPLQRRASARTLRNRPSNVTLRNRRSSATSRIVMIGTVNRNST